MNNNIVGIYKVVSPSNEVYIGQSWNIRARWRGYFTNDKKKERPIVKSIDNYGAINHAFSILHELPIDVAQDVLDIYEDFYINAYTDCGIEMMNIRKGGTHGCHSEESKSKMKGKNGVWMKGRKIPELSIKKRHETRLKNKKPLSLESRNNYRNAKLGSNNSSVKLTESQVFEILKLNSENGLTHRELAMRYNMSVTSIASIFSGRTWSHITKINIK